MRSHLFIRGLLVFGWFCLCSDGFAFEIFALGTSLTNCHGVDRDKIFPVRLQEILRADGFDATVVNGGVDGDEPRLMMRRLQAAMNSNTRMVIFEPGGNDADKSSNVLYAEKILSYLKEQNVPTIYASIGRIQTTEEGSQTAKKYDAYYYGHWHKNVPRDGVHYQFDVDPNPHHVNKSHYGHMSAEGCLLVAKNMTPLVEKILREKSIR